jgi:hypothetical protein
MRHGRIDQKKPGGVLRAFKRTTESRLILRQGAGDSDLPGSRNWAAGRIHENARDRHVARARFGSKLARATLDEIGQIRCEEERNCREVLVIYTKIPSEREIHSIAICSCQCSFSKTVAQAGASRRGKEGKTDIQSRFAYGSAIHCSRQREGITANAGTAEMAIGLFAQAPLARLSVRRPVAVNFVSGAGPGVSGIATFALDPPAALACSARLLI